MRHFKLPLIVTAIAFVVCIAVGIAGATLMIGSGGNVEKRAEILGQATGALTMLVIAPFWIYGAYQFGKERRAAQSKPQAKPKSPRKPGS
jgi:Na+/proline symporter